MALDAQNEFFDLYQVFVNEVVGDPWLAVLLGLIILAYATIKYKMPFQLSILFSMLFLAVMFEGTNFAVLWVFVVLAAATQFYFSIAKALEV